MPSCSACTVKGRLRMAAALSLLSDHRLEAIDAGADRLDRVIGAVLETVLRQDLLRLQRIGGVGRIDHERAAAHVGERLDLALDEELVHPAVATGDDHHVVLADLDHRQRVVDGGMHHIGCPGGEAVALAARILGELQLDLEPAPLENPLGDAGMQRKRLGLGKGIDPQPRRLIRARGCRAEGERACRARGTPAGRGRGRTRTAGRDRA